MSQDADPIYYRLVRTRKNIDAPYRIVIAELQWFDEPDYNHDNYLTEKTFETEDDALAFAKRVCAHEQCPTHVREMLLPLIESRVNVDDWFTEEDK